MYYLCPIPQPRRWSTLVQIWYEAQINLVTMKVMLPLGIKLEECQRYTLKPINNKSSVEQQKVAIN